MNTVAFIFARGGSKGLPDKNIKLFSGKPLIAHTIINAIESKIFSDIVVSTDNQDYSAEIAELEKYENLLDIKCDLIYLMVFQQLLQKNLHGKP